MEVEVEDATEGGGAGGVAMAPTGADGARKGRSGQSPALVRETTRAGPTAVTPRTLITPLAAAAVAAALEDEISSSDSAGSLQEPLLQPPLVEEAQQLTAAEMSRGLSPGPSPSGRRVTFASQPRGRRGAASAAALARGAVARRGGWRVRSSAGKTRLGLLLLAAAAGCGWCANLTLGWKRRSLEQLTRTTRIITLCLSLLCYVQITSVL